MNSRNALIAASFGLCVGSLCVGSTAAQFKVLAGNVYDGMGGPLGRGVYSVKGTIVVPKGKTLTIKPHNGAAILKFAGGGIRVQGRIILPDVALSWAVFTSLKDDTQGGDTNGDGSATSPAPGDWNGVHLDWGSELSSGSSFHNAQFWFGGGNGAGMISSRNNPGTKLTIKGCKFRFGTGVGVRTGFSDTVATGNLVENCTGNAWQGQLVRLGFVTGNTARKNKGGDFIRRLGASIKWPATPFTAARSQTLNGSNVFVTGDWIRVPKGAKLVIPAGARFKFKRGTGITSRGSLEVRGTRTNRVVMTTIDDDTVGGDTEKNGGATQPKAGDFAGIQLFTDPGRVESTDLRFGGTFGYDIDLQNTAATVKDCSFTDSSGHGVRIGAQANTLQTITDCRFVRVKKSWIHGINWDSLALCARNTASQGGLPIEVNARMRAATVDITTANLIGSLITMRFSTSVPSGGVLNIHAGIHIKPTGRFGLSGGSGRLNILGTARDPVIVTSFKDDSLGGDTNGDGSATKPLPGDWSGLSFVSRAPASRVEHCIVRYANWGVFSASKVVELDSVRSDYAASNGFSLQDATTSLRNLVCYRSQKNGIMLNGGSARILHATVHACKGTGIQATPAFSGSVVNSISWANTGGNFVGLGAGKVRSSDGGFGGQNGNINLDPQFLGPSNLELKPTSPCLDRGDLATGIATQTDFAENSRASDHAFSGSAVPDIGAHERTAVGLAVDRGFPELGKTQSFHTFARGSLTGVSVFLLGFQDISLYIPPFGIENAGLAGLIVLGVQPFNGRVPLPIPNDPKLVGVRFAVQALAFPATKPGRGAFTNVLRGTIRRDG